MLLARLHWRVYDTSGPKVLFPIVALNRHFYGMVSYGEYVVA
jgi:hypothetical protein